MRTHLGSQGLALVVAAGCTGLGAGPEDGMGEPDPSGQPVALESCPPADLLQPALCLCDDLADVGLLTIGPGASTDVVAGVNGRTHFVNWALIDGTLFAFGGLEAVSGLSIARDLISTTDVTWVGEMSVGE